MGNKQSNKYPGYTLVKSNDEKKILVKNEKGDQFVVKKLSTRQEKDVNFLLHLDHPHIVHHKEIIRDGDDLYLVLDHCEGGDLAEKIKQATGQFSEKEILDWTVQICMALKHLHDQQILHKDLQPKSLLFTACGTIRLGEFDKWFTDVQTAETESLAYFAPENLHDTSYYEKSEIWRLGCIICEMCTLKKAFSSGNTDEIIKKICRSSYEHLPTNFSEDLQELIKDTLQVNPADRPSVSEILMRPFIIKHLREMSKKTVEELNKSLDELRTLADDLEKIHFNTTVGSLSGGVIGLVGGILSVVGLALTPFTLGASLIVTGVGIGVATAGGVASGVSNVTKMVNQRSNRQNIKMIITLFQEKINSTSCCIQNIKIAVETLKKELSTNRETFLNGTSAGARLGRGLGGIAELIPAIFPMRTMSKYNEK
ncbi:serine/threonine-protein kinase Nek1 isoform X2 [Danio rerio]|uniref:Serine/threonine-protein kinase Nek1 isoform X2 n=3 Tax=Danio rerio TaxID=7955 RepID=A0AC58G2N5_DANRE